MLFECGRELGEYSSPEEMHMRFILAAQAQPGTNLANDGTKAINNSWSFYDFTSNFYQILNSLFSENKQDLFYLCLIRKQPQSELKACHFFERNDPVVWLDWHVPGAPAQHTLSRP